MKHPVINLLRLAGLAMIVIVALLFAVFVGDQGPWYFAWVVGTVMIVLISGAGAMLFDTQEERRLNLQNKEQQQ